MLLTVLIVLVILYLIAITILSGPDLTMYDAPTGEKFAKHDDDDEVTQRFIGILRDVRKRAQQGKSIKKVLRVVREFADNLSEGLETDTQFTEANAGGVACEWAIAPNANPSKRVLFLHGGAFLFGSPEGHRKFADQLSKLSGAVVLSVDYRMLPENKRGASIEDAQIAYQWLLKHGPDGKLELDKLLISGDSAGGNLALMLAGWAKDHCERQADAVVAFSPSTDMTLASPTIKAHRHSDKILGEGLGALSKIPAPIRAWVSLIAMRINPANSLASPLFQDLSNLPPTLIQASSNEMLLGEAIRYTNKATISGSDVKLQIWEQQIHDWQLFNMGHGSANTAWQEVDVFLKAHFN